MTVDGRRLAIDIVVPLYNEEAIAAEFHRRLMGVVTPLRRDHDVRIYYVNDGSVDNTGAELAKLMGMQFWSEKAEAEVKGAAGDAVAPERRCSPLAASLT